MGFVEKFNFFGTEAIQIPCIRKEGAPTTETEGAVGCLYMDTLTGELYKCTAIADGVYTWKPIIEESIPTDAELLKSGLTLTEESGLIGNGTWTISSVDEPFLNPDGINKYCTRKLKTSFLPYVESGDTPWKYNFWKNGANISVELTYAAAKENNFVTDIDFDEVAISYGYGWTGDGTDSVTLYISESDKYKYNKILVIGDSISTDAYGTYTKWVSVLINDGFFPTNTTNNSVSATGFVAKYTGDDPEADNDFITRLASVENKSDYDLVIVFGGINDYIQSVPLGESGSDDTVYFKPAVDSFFSYLVNNFTQARIAVLSPLRTYNIYANTGGIKQEEYAAYIRDVAKSYCLPVLNLTEESGFCPFVDTFKEMWTLIPNGYNTADGVHPNAEYQKKYLAPMIRRFLENLA